MNDEHRNSKSGGKIVNTAADVADKINELYLVLPKEIFNKENSGGHKISSSQVSENINVNDLNKMPNKGTVLSKAVSYVETLQNDIDTGNRTEVDKKNEILGLLELMNKQNIPYEDILRDMGVSKQNDLLASYTSAEVLLKELLDIGPLAGTNGNGSANTQK